MAKTEFVCEIFFKILSLGVLITQLGVLDYYVIRFVHDDDLGPLWWILLTDLFILFFWIESLWHWLFLKLYRKIVIAWRRCRGQDAVDGGEGIQGNEAKRLRTAFLAWFLYTAAGLIPRIAVIFRDHDNVLNLTSSGNNSAVNTIKIAVAVTAILFLTLSSSHHNAQSFSRRRYYLERITSGVTWDILDSWELLETLFNLENYDLPVSMRNAIIGFTCINFILPTISLLEMRETWGEGSVGSRRLNFKILYILANLLFVDISYLVIRIILWHQHDLNISEFVVKNVICIYLNASDVWEFWGPSRPWRCPHCQQLIIKQYIETHKHTHEGHELKTEGTNTDIQDREKTTTV
ncbi:uncharacterized protein LOC134197037 [Corticium candelabrum]|uniref:uncharacterized protein LOC134197037 n=1 Tax=Corticium candelabrum TaxID=121492 RepID=UPI002E25A18C|nr:uncharacterized protein LOC134197037 [Corticium candelabrum]